VKKLIFAAVAASLLAAAVAQAADERPTTMLPTGGFGFRSTFTPLGAALAVPQAAPTIGIRHWFNEYVGADIGAGYYTREIKPLPEKFTGYTIDVGLPISIKRVSEKVNFMFRPGFVWSSLEDRDETPPPLKIVWTTIGVTGELEVEWMVADKLSISASQGFGYFQMHDDGNPKTTQTYTGNLGSNFTQLGFHVYLW